MVGLDVIGLKGRLAELADPALVAPGRIAGIGEFCVEKCGNAGLRHFNPYETRAHCDAIGIIMFARESRGKRLAHQRAAHLRVTVDADRDADARAAQRDPEFDRAFSDDLGEAVTVIGIVDARAGFGPEVGDLVSLFDEPFGKVGFQFDGGVVGGDGDAHVGAIGVGEEILHPLGLAFSRALHSALPETWNQVIRRAAISFPLFRNQ